MKTYNPTLLLDFYKVSHRRLYRPDITHVYSTWTPRASRVKNVDEVVVFGQQAFIKNYLIDYFNENFFNVEKDVVINDYKRFIKYTLGEPNPETTHLEELHDLGYLPLEIKSLPEGTVAPVRVPTMTIINTDPRFFWLTNYIETLASCELWQASTSATISREYKKILENYALKTTASTDFVMFQGHDFSMRGMSSLQSAITSGMGHLLSFVGTDTVPAIIAAEKLYNANIEKELIGTSVPATEHSIQCSYADDMEYFRRTITEVHPSGIVSIVSDGYDLWDVIRRVIPALKQDILARKGSPIVDKVVIRPDSGDPVLIICGDPNAPKGSLEHKGVVEALWEIFGGTVSPTGYTVLDSHIGVIYGDAITLNRCEEICERLAKKRFASTNVVFGIGSYTFQYNTRDTFGYALKSTMCVLNNGEEMQIFKDPVTDNGIKKSQKGAVAVLKDGKSFKFVDGLSLKDSISGDQLRTIFKDGKLLVDDNFTDIKNRLK